MNRNLYLSPESGEIDLSIEKGILTTSLFDADNYTENFLDGGEDNL